MNLGVQYYRPPFPNRRYWRDDFARIHDSGLNTIQLWVLWAWVEAKSGYFRFEDYDELFELADKNGLGVILSTLAEIQPYWIHREIPGSEMIDHMGRKVVSSNPCECHFGLTPGGCTDNPGVWDRMKTFFTEVVNRYRSAPVLRGWDAWNELRWNVQADGLVCYCPNTINAFRNWLSGKYGGLDGLNVAWCRRYGSFDDVLPGKLPGRTYTEMMAFEHFLTWRANQHALDRYKLIKCLDPTHPVTVHGDKPCVLTGGWSMGQALDRGNDWIYADGLDGVGCSSFPKWAGIDDADFSMRVEFAKSAVRKKELWLSEVQGGRSALGFNIHPPVDALSQQRWIWNGLSCGATTILFWCWRDEVFGRESGGFGLAGDDGFAEQRLAAMKTTGKLIERHRRLLAKYESAPPRVGIFFSPQTYYLNWAQEGNSDQSVQTIMGYARSLTRKSIPYKLIEEEHLDALSDQKILFMPRIIVTDEAVENALADFVMAGGTLFCESECGAFDSQGKYRYPMDRFTARLSGCCEIGRRNLETDSIEITRAGKTFKFPVTQWLTPWKQGKNTSVFIEVPVGKGKMILCGAYLGDAYRKKPSLEFEDFLETLVRGTGWTPEVEILSPSREMDNFVYIKYGLSQETRMAYVFFPPNHDTVRLRFRHDFFKTSPVRDLITDQNIPLTKNESGLECILHASAWRLAILVDE